MYGCRLMGVCLWGLWVKGACKIGVYVSLRVYRALRVYGIIEVWENVGSGVGFTIIRSLLGQVYVGSRVVLGMCVVLSNKYETMSMWWA